MIDYTGIYDFSPKLTQAAAAAEEKCRKVFERIDEIAEYNEARVLRAFTDHRISAAHLLGTTGYGYDDMGRDTLDAVFAQIVGAEDALVRHNLLLPGNRFSASAWGTR